MADEGSLAEVHNIVTLCTSLVTAPRPSRPSQWSKHRSITTRVALITQCFWIVPHISTTSILIRVLCWRTVVLQRARYSAWEPLSLVVESGLWRPSPFHRHNSCCSDACYLSFISYYLVVLLPSIQRDTVYVRRTQGNVLRISSSWFY